MSAPFGRNRLGSAQATKARRKRADAVIPITATYPPTPELGHELTVSRLRAAKSITAFTCSPGAPHIGRVAHFSGAIIMPIA